MHEAEQREVDRIYATLRSQTTPQLPKGLSQTTLDLVRDVPADAEIHLTAADVAQRAGVSRVPARRYLEHLCETGHANTRLRYGTAGRPEHQYRTALPGSPPDDASLLSVLRSELVDANAPGEACGCPVATRWSVVWLRWSRSQW